MSTIESIPKELLLRIFQHLPTSDLLQCEKVCKLWQSPSHTTLLTTVELHGELAVEQFIASIDRNPHTSYLNAVKTINVKYVRDRYSNFDNEKFKKLFFRFPNLNTVKIIDSFRIIHCFIDHECQTFLKCCPKLKTFDVDYHEYLESVIDNRVDYSDTVNRLPNLMTAVDLGKLDDDITDITMNLGGIAQFIKSYPRLKTIRGLCGDDFNNIQKALAFFTQTPQLVDFSISDAIDDEPDFFERYTSTKSTKDMEQLVKRLSKVREFGISYQASICADAIPFIDHYLTGLQSLTLSCVHTGDWTNGQQTSFDDALNLVCSVNNGSIRLRALDISHLGNYLSLITRSMSRQIPSAQRNSVKRTLRVNTSIIDEDPEAIGITHNAVNMALNSKRSSFIQDIEVWVNDSVKFRNVGMYLNNRNYNVQSVDVLEVNIKARWDYEVVVEVDDYIRILYGFPFVKEVILDTPESFQNEQAAFQKDKEDTLSMVEDVTLRPAVNISPQSLLDQFFYSFPNLKRLKIYYTPGTWNIVLGEFRLVLAKYTLEKLTVDVTLVRSMMEDHLNKEEFTDQGFFVLEIEYSSYERQLFTISMDLSSIIKIHGVDLKNFTLGKDYLRVLINITSLQHLELCMVSEKLNGGEREEYFHFPPGKRVDMVYADVF